MVMTKETLKKGKEECVWKMKTRAQVHVKPAPAVLVDPPVPVLEMPPSQEEQVGRSLELSPTKQLAQMAAEARPSMSGGEEPAHKKL